MLKVATVPTDLFVGWIDEFRVVLATNHIKHMIDVAPVADFTPPVDEYDWHRCISAPTGDRNVPYLGFLTDDAVNASALVLDATCVPTGARQGTLLFPNGGGNLGAWV